VLLIKLENINLSFADSKILDNLTLQIKQREKICLSGPSGRGKTSLLKMIAGLVIPDSGRVSVDGAELTPENINLIRKKITWIPQNINLPVKNASELIDLLGLNNVDSQVLVNFDSLGLDEEYLRKDFNEISGGEKQRIIISIVLTIDKPIILLDEPTSALDKKSIEQLANLISNLTNKTVVSASHNQQWMDITGRVVNL